MYNIKLENYVPEPNLATSDRIVAVHYYAAWKYVAAGIHEFFNDLAELYSDRTPADQGFGDYDKSWKPRLRRALRRAVEIEQINKNASITLYNL